MRLVTLSSSHEIPCVQQDFNLAESLILHSGIVCRQVLTLEKKKTMILERGPWEEIKYKKICVPLTNVSLQLIPRQFKNQCIFATILLRIEIQSRT